MIHQEKYLNVNYPGFVDVIEVFLKESNVSSVPVSACFAVAGPVLKNKVTLTNRGHWVIDGDAIAAKVGMHKVHIVNDFVGMGYGLLTLDEATECVVLQVKFVDYSC